MVIRLISTGEDEDSALRVASSDLSALFSAHLQTVKRRSMNVLHVVLSDIESDRCCYNIHLRFDKGLEVPDAKVCGICIIDAYQRIVDKRKQLTVFANAP